MPTPEIMIEPRPAPGRRAPERPLVPERSSVVPPPPPEAAAAKKPRRWWRVLGWAALIAAFWCGWALYALYDLSSALDNEDAVALERRIDWASVRQGLREDLRVMLGSSRFGEAAPNSTVDPLSTQRAVVALIRAARLNERGWEIAQPGQNGPASPWLRAAAHPLRVLHRRTLCVPRRPAARQRHREAPAGAAVPLVRRLAADARVPAGRRLRQHAACRRSGAASRTANRDDRARRIPAGTGSRAANRAARLAKGDPLRGGHVGPERQELHRLGDVGAPSPAPAPMREKMRWSDRSRFRAGR